MTALTNPNALPCAQKLYAQLQEVFGRKMLLGQQEFPGRDRADQEMEHILRETGKLPAIRGLDLMHDDYAGTLERSRAWHQRGGIVSICWHTGLVGKGYTESQAEQPDFEQLLTPGTPEHELLMRRWDDAADALEALQREDIPVLWRPFHEFNGGWFWWGKGTGQDFIRLWRKMYDYYTHERKLNNLIWVLGYADNVDPAWYPGDAYCDIGGSDTYKGVTTHAKAYRDLTQLCPGKPLAFHETGIMPGLDAFAADGAMWLWMLPWHGKWLMEDNDPDRLRLVYHDPRALTLEDVKNWR